MSVEVLRQVFNAALDSLQDRVGDTVELDKDFFWSIPQEAKYDNYTPPEADQLTLGQLSETWNNLVRLAEPGETVPTYALVWIGDVLKALGYQVP
ncbi:hypothetical protein [Saccharopolyspora hattusasensis]|uniref:hypothetical protein n=1 Tax=Saccharopolyspora hattusasensis TaxID=1128679 RepID=UPI003D968FA1